MIPLRKALTVLLLGAMLFTASAYRAVNAAPSFTTEGGLKFTFPLPGNNSNVVSFLLFSTEGDVAKTTVQVRQVKSPAGENLSLDAARAQLETDTVTPSGVRVSITLDPRFFLGSGDYEMAVFFRGDTGIPSLAATVVINRPAPNINEDELKDQTVWLTRWFPLPFGSASDEIVLYMRETTGKVPLNAFKVVGQSIHVKDTKELVPGKLTVTPLPDDPAAAPATTPDVNVGAGMVKKLKVRFSDLRFAGKFNTRLTVTSPSFSGEKTIPLNLSVQDFFLFPLLAIGLGVVGGYLTRRLVAVERPRNENRVQLLRLQAEVEQFRQLVNKPASRDTIHTLLAQLRNAQEANDKGDFASVRAELTKIQEKLDEFRKAQVQAEGEVQTALNLLRSQAERLKNSNTLTAEETKDLKSVGDKLDDVDRLLRLGMLDDAQLNTESARQRLEDLRTRKFTNYFTLLKVELSTLTLSTDAAARRAALETEIKELLGSKEFEKLQLKLDEFKSFVEEQKAAARPPGARAEEEPGLPQVPTDPVPAGPFTRLEIITPVEQRVSGTIVSFQIVDGEGIIGPEDQLQWFFGEVGFDENKLLKASHLYQNSGRFQVRVDIINSGVKSSLPVTITIAPSDLEKARRGVFQTIMRNECVLSLVALLLATITGLIFFYSGKPFGSLADYLLAILWGFGIDNSIKGFAGVLSKISSPEALL